MKKLTGKVAVITGGNSGIGLSTAQTFMAEGAKVIFTGRRQAGLDEAAKVLGPDAIGILSDAGSVADLEKLREQISAYTPHVDILFINAGVAAFMPLASATEAHFDTIMDTNFKGAYFTVQTLLPLLRDGGSIIFNTSINASVGMPNTTVYAASKAAVLAITRVLATELSGRGIRVNAISPGPIETPVYGKLGLTAAELEGFGGILSKKVLLGRFGKPGEIAKTALFLASDDASFINGTELVADGGLRVNAVVH